MRTHLECVACLVRQAVEITRENVPFPDQETFLKGILECIARFDYTSPPPLMAMEMYDRLREHAGIEDPYAEAKRVYTEKALSCSQRLTELITR
ncbi:MAG: ARMT1-like domain-containing protein, partial [Desulfomonilia bacterium]